MLNFVLFLNLFSVFVSYRKLIRIKPSLSKWMHKRYYFYNVKKIHYPLNLFTMASYPEIANELAKSYVQSRHKKYAINQMIFEINYLADPQSKEPLGYNAKAAILKHIHELLSGQKTFTLKEGEEIFPEFKDITIFFAYKQTIIKQLKLSNKERAMLN